MLVYPDSFVWSNTFVPYLGSELGEPSKKSDVFFFVTENNYMINIPAGYYIQAKEIGKRTTKYKYYPIEEVFENHEKYQLVLERPSLSQWKDNAFSSVKFTSTLQELIVSAFVLGYISTTKRSFIKRKAKLKKRLDTILAEKIDIYIKSYESSKEFKEQLDALNARILMFPNTITDDQYGPNEKGKIESNINRINRLLGYLLVITRAFGTLNTNSISFNLDQLSDERCRLVQFELLNVGVTSTFDTDNNVITVDFMKYTRTLSLITELLFDIHKPLSRHQILQHITYTDKIDDSDMIELDKATEMWVDGIHVVQSI